MVAFTGQISHDDMDIRKSGTERDHTTQVTEHMGRATKKMKMCSVAEISYGIRIGKKWMKCRGEPGCPGLRATLEAGVLLLRQQDFR